MEAEILKWGGIASALTAIGTFFYKVLVKPRKEHREAELRARQAMIDELKQLREDMALEQQKLRQEMSDAQKRMEDKLDSMQEDLVDLERYELKQAHARLMGQGWCSDEEKAGVLDLYDKYKVEKKRNSLIDTYKADIQGLPNHLPEEEV